METNIVPINEAAPLPLHEAMQQLIQAYEADASSYDELADKYEALENSNATLRLELAKVKKQRDNVIDENQSLLAALKQTEEKEAFFNKQAEQVTKNAEKHMQLVTQKERELAQAKNKLKDAILTVANYKQLGTPKQIREKFKKYQGTIEKNQAANLALKKIEKNYRQEILSLKDKINDLTIKLSQVSMTSVYSNNDEYLMLFPAMLQMKLNNYQENQVVMLYLHKEGRGGLIAIDEDGIPQFPKAPKGGLRPTKSTMEHSGQFLRRIKAQGWTLNPNDLENLGLVA